VRVLDMVKLQENASMHLKGAKEQTTAQMPPTLLDFKELVSKANDRRKRTIETAIHELSKNGRVCVRTIELLDADRAYICSKSGEPLEFTETSLGVDIKVTDDLPNADVFEKKFTAHRVAESVRFKTLVDEKYLPEIKKDMSMWLHSAKTAMFQKKYPNMFKDIPNEELRALVIRFMENQMKGWLGRKGYRVERIIVGNTVYVRLNINGTVESIWEKKAVELAEDVVTVPTVDEERVGLLNGNEEDKGKSVAKGSWFWK
jgi:hypothetical protein